MSKHRSLQKNLFVLLLFFALFISLVDATLSPASAQDETPTPEVATPAGTQADIPELPTVGPVSVLYPLHGQTLKGSVKITGSIALDGWTGYELASADAASTTPDWLVFASGTNPLAEADLLAIWDTTAISDGDYNLRLRVLSPSGDQDVIVYGLHIRNYSVDTPMPTPTTPASATPSATSTATVTRTSTPRPTGTPYSTATRMPPNPASLRTDDIAFSLGRGALFSTVLFAVFGLFLRLRRR